MSATALLRDTATLRSVVLRSGARDTSALRNRFERALADVEWLPSGLPPRALLLVRRLVADGRRGLRPQSEGGGFGRGVSAALRAHAQVARRPWLHDDAAQADAVLFVDEAELLACLWRDWARGALPQRWWWHSVLAGLDPAAWLRLKAWPQAERLVPALTLLAGRGEAGRCVARMEERDAARALQAVTSAYALVHLSEGAETASGNAVDAETSPVDAPGSQAGQISRTLLAVQRRLMSLVPESDSSTLASTQRRLLVVALGIARAPAWARTSAFATVMRQLERAQPADDHVMPARSQRVPAGAGERASTRGMTTPTDEVDALPALSPHAKTQTRPTPEEAVSAMDAAGAAPTDVRRHGTLSTPLVDALPDTPSYAVPIVASPRTPTLAQADTAASTLHTCYGGLFYLLNAALALRVYGDFTMPRHPDLALSPWDLLAWTGRAWFGDGFARDPLGPLLARLSGRAPAQAPGRFDAPPDWRIGPAWHTPWGAAECLHVHATRQRLRVLHPQGFAMFDVRRDTALTPLRQAGALCGNEVLQRAKPPFRRVPRRADARWLHHWLAYLDARLRIALDTDADVPTLVCRHDAEVRVSASHVDVHLALAGLPLALRFAGLDRDPGWIPAAGCSLSFHFE
jgi:hypothetical protein